MRPAAIVKKPRKFHCLGVRERGCNGGALSRQDVSIFKHLPTIALLAPVYFVSCIAGTLAQRRFKGNFARQTTLILIIVIAGTSLAVSYNVLG